MSIMGKSFFFTSQIVFLMSKFQQSDWLDAGIYWQCNVGIEIKSILASSQCLRLYAGANIIIVNQSLVLVVQLYM